MTTVKDAKKKLLERLHGIRRYPKVLDFLSAVSVALATWSFKSSDQPYNFYVGGLFLILAIVFYVFKETLMPEMAAESILLADELEDSLRRETAFGSNAKTGSILLKTLIGQHLDSGVPIETDRFTKAIFKTFLSLKGDLLDMSDSEEWNFALYIFNKGSRTLEVVHREAGVNHPSWNALSRGNLGRAWKTGKGHTGLSFKDKKTILISNYNDQAAQLLKDAVPKGQRRPYDDKTYLSFIAVPLMYDDKPPIGVFVATSNVENRFHSDNQEVIEEIARSLWAVYALYNYELES